MKASDIAGYVWAAPLTAPAIVYVLSFQALGWYVYVGRRGHALVWATVPSKMPAWLLSLWQGPPNVYGHSIGNVVVIDAGDAIIDDDDPFFKYILSHEQVHVQQAMRLGLWMPVFYWMSYLTALALDNVDAYRDGLFEIDARRSAYQEHKNKT